MDSHKKISSSIRGFYSAAEELYDDKCAICHLEIQEPLLQTTCGHKFCIDCMIRYDPKEFLNFRIVCCLRKSDSNFSSFSSLTFLNWILR